MIAAQRTLFIRTEAAPVEGLVTVEVPVFDRDAWVCGFKNLPGEGDLQPCKCSRQAECQGQSDSRALDTMVFEDPLLGGHGAMCPNTRTSAKGR